LNRPKSEKHPDGLLDLLIQHYDELSQLVALAETACDGPESRSHADELSGPQTEGGAGRVLGRT
jgi:hypothetical protein